MKLLPLILALATPAHAQAPQCLPVTEALEAPQANHGETVRADALMSDGSVMVITAAPSGAWTALIISADGVACMAAFAAHDAEPAGTDS